MQLNSEFIFVPLCILIAYSLLKPLLSRDKSLIWSPITIVALTMIYYVILPSLKSLRMFDADCLSNQYLFYMAAFVFYVSILIAFNRTKAGSFCKWNMYFNENNVKIVSIYIFLFALACYVPFRGFRYTINADDSIDISSRTGFVSYFIDLISLFVSACCVAFVAVRNSVENKFKKILLLAIILYISLVIYIVGGFRYRIVILILSLATTYHLYPFPRKFNYKVFVPIGILIYLGFAVMERSRTYGAGINIEAARSVSFEDASAGASESESVCCFSINVIDNYSKNRDFVFFEPLVTAVLMPIPRSIFPWKPDGGYLKEIQIRTIGDSSGGAACLSFAEGYISFGFVGIVLYGLMVGWVCKKIWGNYCNNPNSIGAILLLALMNGFVYIWISRGYMAAAFNNFMFYVILPFWLTGLIKKLKKI